MAVATPRNPQADAPRMRFGSIRTQYVIDQEQILRSNGDRIPDPDFAATRDPEFWKKADGNSAVKSSRTYYRHLIAAPRWKLEAPSSADKILVPYMEKLIGKVKNFRTAALGFADARFRGMIPARMFGEFKEEDLLGKGNKLRWHRVVKIRIQNKGRWELKKWNHDGEMIFAWAMWDFDKSQWVLPEHPDWFIHHRYNESEEFFYGDDLGRALYFLIHAEHILREASLDTAERFGAPWILAQLTNEMGGVSSGGGVDMTAWATKVDRVLKQIQKMRAHNAMVGDERVKVNLLEANLTGARLIRELIDEIKTEIRILILGSNLPTSATGGGSFSLAQIQDQATRRLVNYDRHLLGETLTEQLVRRLFEWNRPAFSQLIAPDGRRLSELQPPKLLIIDEEILSPEERRQTLEIAEKGKLKVRRKDLYALANLTPPDEDDEDVVELGGGGGGGFPVGGRFAEQHSPVWLDYAGAEDAA